MLAKAIGVPHISTGAMLRDNVERGTELGKTAQAIMVAGDLVPDDVVVVHDQDSSAVGKHHITSLWSVQDLQARARDTTVRIA